MSSRSKTHKNKYYDANSSVSVLSSVVKQN